FDFDGSGASGATVAPIEVLAWDVALDYAVVRVDDAARAPLVLGDSLTAGIGQQDAIAVNIIQHPNGEPKRLGIRNNLVTEATRTELKYFTDTLGGSSGSPVLNDQ